ncbi:MAG: cobalamin-independent methionine synthase II family protein [Rhodospirillales bacterium]|jgi:5-methyltetrahydropteroyltriglutamate--homocysteine methyltransferase
MIEARAETVGSLLRPDYLIQARAASDDVSAAEDRAVRDAIQLQESAGLEIITDGEMRRLSFQSQMTEAISGFGQWDLDAFLWGDWFAEDGAPPVSRQRPEKLGVTGKLRSKRFLSAQEYSFLAANTSQIPKITLPSPGLFANFYDPDLSGPVYPTLESLIEDLVDILAAEVRELARLGARYIQIDAPHYPLLMQSETRAFYEGLGWDLEQWLGLGIAADNAVMDAAPDVCFALHLCRGNQQGRWLAEGGYDAIARQIFAGTHATRLLLEYDDRRSGDFAPLAQVPEDKWVVLGLISTKHPELEDQDMLCRRIEAAARYVGLDRLAISPQCGFSPSVLPGGLSQTDQAAKLDLLVSTARKMWGYTKDQ